MTTRGFRHPEFVQIAVWIDQVLRGLIQNPDANGKVEKHVLEEVQTLCGRFPIYGRATG